MIKNSEVKKLIFIELIIAFFIIIILLIVNNKLYTLYKEEQIINNSQIIGSILNKHPELEQEIIDSILVPENYELGYQTLKKYGLANSSSLGYLAYNEEVKDKIFYLNCYTVIGVVLILSLTWIFIKRQYRKIGKIDEYMNNILAGDYSMNIKDYCEGDISNLKNDVYKMTIKLKEQSEMLQKDKIYLEETLQDISHQIKTPLTSMYMINDILSDEKLSKKDKAMFLNKNKAQLERIEWLVTSLLKLSRLDSGSVVMKKEKISVANLIKKALGPVEILIDLKNIKVEVNHNDEQIIADFNWTVEALVNIIKNACEHTKDKLTITVSSNPICSDIKIKDNGPGISKKDLPYIFERFYKGDHNKESIGIGLNMSMKIIKTQNGIIEVDTSDDGTTFTLKLYKKVF